ncbi:hypothetical protein [Hyphobacterium marinum]|uniref:P/Homo B domain-containing protein n=1 Tax=Hyphobacterium marinum TaxID=3116574 RepID=A0ABU7LZN6_9PROT|nr:hypothetical protein [Hyphobacterium sp. Y6023]MEE2567013.1 hypothetical protein [Hyphobacterium sp. Y6023]
MRASLYSAVFAMIVALSAQAQAQTSISAAILPTARTTTVGQPATAFASIVNSGSQMATGCRPALMDGSLPVALAYQTTSPANALTGTANTPADIAPGSTQNYLFSLTPSQSFDSLPVIIDFLCDDGVRGAYVRGVTTFELSSRAFAPDIIAVAATLSGDGVARGNAPDGFAAFTVSAVNIGAGPAPVTVRPVSGLLDMPVRYDICQTDAQSQCLGPRASSVTVTMGSEPAFFVVRAIGLGAGIPLYADVLRTDVVFSDAEHVVRGRTSVAATFPGPQADPAAGQMPAGLWTLVVDGNGLDHGDRIVGRLAIDPQGGVSGDADRVRYETYAGDYGLQGMITADAAALPQPALQGSLVEAFDIETGEIPPYPVSGVWSHRTGLRATVEPHATLRRRIRAVYSPDSLRTVTLADLADQYDFLYRDGNAEPADLGNVALTAAGGLTVSLPGLLCQVDGTLSQPQAGFNLMTVSLTLSGGGCLLAGVYTGHAAVVTETIGGHETEVIGVVFGDESMIDSFMLARQ